MTLIAAWAGLDCKKDGNKVSSIYFASDSRFSWETDNSSLKYDEGIKVFCSLKYPYLFGYCGDVLFPVHSIERILYKIDCDLFFNTEACSFTNKMQVICKEIETSIRLYPFHSVSFSIIFASRESYYDFHVGLITYCNETIQAKELPIPSASNLIFVGGSGKDSFNKIVCNQKKNPNDGTSRFYYQCLSRAIKDYECPTVGGVPQLVGIFRKGAGIVFGVIEENSHFVLGKRVDYSPKCLHIQWRNSNFEIVNPETMKLQEGAQAQPF